MGAIGRENCSVKHFGPSNVNVELHSLSNGLIASTSTSSIGKYSFSNVIPGKYWIHAYSSELSVLERGSTEMELGFGNVVISDMFQASGYDISGFFVAQGLPVLGVHVYLYSNDVAERNCSRSHSSAIGQRKALCDTISNADGMFQVRSLWML